MNPLPKLAALLLLLICLNLFSCAQGWNKEVSSEKDIQLLIDVVRNNLEKQYFNKEAGKKLSMQLLKMKEQHAFDGITAEHAAERITAMLRKVTRDKHFNVIAYHKTASAQNASQAETPFTGGITQVKMLDQQVGYIRWDACMAGDEAFKKLRQAIDTVAECKHLIIDISENPGGDGASSAFLNQFLYRSKNYQTLLIKKCTGESNWHQSEVIFNYNEGPALFDIPLYIIVSDKTFSAAEYFAFTAQEMKRATILGKTTAGAGNPGQATGVSLEESDIAFWMFIPNCQITTKSGRSIEGIGVAPDVELSSRDWLRETIAYIHKNEKSPSAVIPTKKP